MILVLPSFTAASARSASGRDLDVPLQGEIRLDHGLAAVAAADGHAVVIDLFKQPRLFQFGNDPLAGLEPVQPLVLAAGGIDDPGLVEDIDPVEAVADPDLEVVEIVGRGDLHHAGAELAVHIVVGNHRNLPVHQRQEHLFADQVA